MSAYWVSKSAGSFVRINIIKRHHQKSDSVLVDFLLGQFVSFLFALPTTALIWFVSNKYLAIWGPDNAFLGGDVFWGGVVFFAFISLFFPALFPSLLGKAWQGLINAEKWF